MSASSKIEWTEATWNPTRGCSRVSPGCENCYAERFAHRLSGPGKPYEGLTCSTEAGPRWTGRIHLARDVLEKPLSWTKPRTVFVDSMSDLFHEGIPLDYMRDVFDVMNRAHWHTFQVLTKRIERALELAEAFEWTPNIWLGASVENVECTYRIGVLNCTPAAVRFLSVEPLLERIPDLPLRGIDWVIVGGESGPRARPMEPDWVREIREECAANDIPFFFKQWGGRHKKRNGRVLDNRTWDEMPEVRSSRLARQLQLAGE